MTTKRTLGIDYVILSGQGGRDTTNGATVKGDDTIHLGFLQPLQGSETACKQPIDHFFATYGDVEITCRDCIKVIKDRSASTAWHHHAVPMTPTHWMELPEPPETP